MVNNKTSQQFLLAITLSIILSCCNAWECPTDYVKVDIPMAFSNINDICQQIPLNIAYRILGGASWKCVQGSPNYELNSPDNNLRGLGLCISQNSPKTINIVPTNECDASCEFCSGTATHCTSCPGSGMLLENRCYETCPIGSHQVDSENCERCHSSCGTCTGPSEADCSTCNEGHFNSEGLCEECSSPCTNCVGHHAHCTSCVAIVPYVYEGSCHQACPSGSFETSPTSCEACADTCATCSGSASNCLSCHPCDPFLYNNECHNSCPEGSFADSAHTCATCSENCATCTENESKCTSCPSALPFLYENVCYETCPAGSFENSPSSCLPCSESCATCTENESKCTSCPSAIPLLYENVCYETCPSETFQASSNTCADCSPLCTTCSGNADACTSCPTSHPVLYNHKCHESCPQFSFEGDTPNSCEECPSTCSGPCKLEESYPEPLCLICNPSGSVHYDGECYMGCPAGTFENKPSACELCSDLCATCTGTATNCLSCKNPSDYFYQGECFSSCPAGTQISTTSSQACEDCQGEDCSVECDEETPLLHEGTCVESCPLGFFESLGGCARCSPGCATCNDSASTCTGCSGQTPYLYNGACLSGCPPETYPEDNACHDL